MKSGAMLGLSLLAMLSVSPGITTAQTVTSTQPAPAVQIQRMSRVEVFAFAPLTATPGQQEWIGRGIQESLQNEVSHTGAMLLLPAATPASGADALATARQNHADLAVIGSYQIAGDDLRVTGHLLDVAGGTTLGSFAATGPQKDLFTIEDALGEQMRRLLPASSTLPQQLTATAAPLPAPAPTVVYQPTPQPDYPPPTVNYYYDTVPTYPYDYAGYSDLFPYGYYGGGFYGGIGIYSGGYRGDYYRHHDFDRGGYIGGRSSGTGNVYGGHAFGGGRGVGGPAFNGGGRSFGAGRAFGGGHR
jgi:TolB-like protein